MSPMLFNCYAFPTREHARTWLQREGFNPCAVPNVPGLWEREMTISEGHIVLQTVQAFRNLAGAWTVQKYVAPDPANYICE